MKNIQKLGGFAALYLAAAYVATIVIFIFVLDYPGITDSLQKVALLADKPAVMQLSNLLSYVIFGFALVIFMLALYESLKDKSPLLIRFAAVTGIIWAGCLIASGMVSNAGMTPVLALYQTDPVQAALTWSMIESVANGLGGANGEILGGVMTLLAGIAALRSTGFTKWAGYLGILVGVVGIASTLPALNSLVTLFGLSQVVWFVWMGALLLRRNKLQPKTA